MSWNAFYVKQTPTVGSSEVIISDDQFPFGINTMYKDLCVWVTTTSGSSYTVSIKINDVIQDNISITNQKFVSVYNLPNMIVKDTSFKLKISLLSSVTTNFVILICGEYWT